MSRLVNAGSVIYDQLDFYNPPGGVNRAQGVVISSLTLNIFANNTLLPWTLNDGTSIIDSDISAGVVYFSQINVNGFYQIKFFPDRVGFWRVIITNLSLQTELIKEYDVLPVGTLKPGPSTGGLTPSFSITDRGPMC